MPERILIVDDEADLLEVMQEFLSEKGYEVVSASDGEEALKVLEAESDFDLLLSDINMPGMKGFELLAEARRRHASLKTALITAYDVRDYLRLAREHDVGNIITKTTPFNFKELEMLVRNILTEDVFGLEKYVFGRIHSRTITHSQEVEGAIREIVSQLPENDHRRKYRQALGEIIINAIYYGARDERGDRKDQWDTNVELSPGEHIVVSWGSDDHKTGVAVRDQGGRLTRERVLFWLERNSTRGPDGLSLGLFDEHGKGIFITRETVDRVIISIKRSAMTEVVMLNYHRGAFEGFRPLWINEF